MLAICAGIAVGLMVAIGGARDGEQRSTNLAGVAIRMPSVQVGKVADDEATSTVGVGWAPEIEGTLRERAEGDAGPTRLVLGAIASDGTPESGVTAAAVSETVAIPEPTVVVPDLGSVQALIVSYDWEDDIAIRIADCESDFNPLAVNPQAVVLSNGGNHATGVFQLLMPLHQWRLNGGSPFDAEANIRAAYGLWLDQGWAPWRECW